MVAILRRAFRSGCRRAFALGFIVLTTWPAAQGQDACGRALDDAETSYFLDEFDAGIAALSGCLADRTLDAPRTIRLYTLLGRLHLGLRHEEEARAAARQLLVLVPTYRPDPSAMEPAFYALLQGIQREAATRPAPSPASRPAPTEPGTPATPPLTRPVARPVAPPTGQPVPRPVAMPVSRPASPPEQTAPPPATPTPSSAEPAAPPAPAPSANAVLDFAEVPPEVVGGLPALLDGIEYPERARQQGVEGRVVVQFVVDAAGVPTDVTVARGVSPELDAEAVRVVRAARFTPGRQDGQPVRVRHALQIPFRLGY